MGTKNDSAISRREFARRAAFASAAASLSPADLLKPDPSTAAEPPLQAPTATKLSPESQSESNSRMQSILAQYGSRLSDAQKADLRRLSNTAQEMLDRLRAYSVENGDGPALYLKPLLEREKKPAAAQGSPKTASAPKKS
jgi:hypothetical protein